MIMPWPCIRSKFARSFRIFSVRTDVCVSPRTGSEHNFHVIESDDWVNVIPVTPDRQVVMVRQFRHGSRKVSLEIPGGLLDPGDTPESAAARELLEETGYEAEAWTKLGTVRPNPALFNNRCHVFLARNARKTRPPLPDPTEEIEVTLLPLSRISESIRKGEIDHAIVIAAFFQYFLRPGQGNEDLQPLT